MFNNKNALTTQMKLIHPRSVIDITKVALVYINWFLIKIIKK
jgi:hypothetical protein